MVAFGPNEMKSSLLREFTVKLLCDYEHTLFKYNGWFIFLKECSLAVSESVAAKNVF